MAEEPPNKKLRYAEADLKVVVGSDVNDKKNDPLVEYHHTVVMAKHSTFVDTWLENGDASTTAMEIYFPDIPPITWKKMISMIENAVASRHCSIQDALECLPFYHKYDFTNGCELCEDILKAYLQPLADVASLDNVAIDTDTLVDAAALVHKLDLDTILPFAETVMYSLLHRDSVHSIKLTEYDIERLVPFISDNLHWPRWTKDEVLSPLFPKYAVLGFSNGVSCSMLTAAVTHIRLSSTMGGLDGLLLKNIGPFEVEWASDRIIPLNEYRLAILIRFEYTGIVGKSAAKRWTKIMTSMGSRSCGGAPRAQTLPFRLRMVGKWSPAS